MTDEATGLSRKLQLTIVPKLDLSQLTDEIKSKVETVTGVKQQANGDGSPVPDGDNNGGGTDTGGDKHDKKESDNKKLKAISTASKVMSTGFEFGKQALTGIQGIITEIMNKVKQSSQFLQTVESLFQLAITLLLLPLGNAIAETILPATIDLVDAVLGLWDEMDIFSGGATLESIVGTVLTKGLTLVGQYLTDIGGLLQGQGDMLGSIGNLLSWVGNLLETGKIAGILNILFNIFEFFTDNITHFLAIYAAYEVAKVGLMLTQIAATAASGSAAGWVGAGLAFTAVGAGIAAGVTESTLNPNLNSHTPISNSARTAHSDANYEAIGGGSGNTYITNYIENHGLTSDEFDNRLRDQTNGYIADAPYQRGY